MKKKIIPLLCFLLFGVTTQAQTMKEYTAGHVFKISLPDYLKKTSGLNDVASIQFTSDERNAYGCVIVDTKEELSLAEVTIASIKEFYDIFINDFLKDESKRKISAPLSQKKGNINFMECDASYYDKDAKGEIYYLIGIVETPTAFYKVLCWTTLENKASLKADFQKIVYSLHD